MSTGGLVVHQAVHGYGRGHRLLVGSAPLPDDIAGVVGRLSDAVPNYRSSTGPYLTGYGLPDGGYALARTWPAVGAERPNTVWTHTLILSSSAVGRVSAGGLRRLLRHPAKAADPSVFDEPIPLAEVPSVTAAAPDPASAAAAIAVYHQAHVVLEEPDSGARESLALALWDQHWVPVRQTLSFCTAPDARPTGNGARRMLSFSSHRASVGVSSPARAKAARLISADLERPGAFREWLHFVGSGERDPRLVATFAEVYVLLRSGHGDGPVRRAESLLDETAPRTSDLRRLKRRLLSFSDTGPRWTAEPSEVFTALSRGRLGELVAAEDASLDRWVETAWLADPDLVLRTIRDTGAAETAPTSAEEEPDTGSNLRQPASEGLQVAFDNSLGKLLTPATLALAASTTPDRVLGVISSRADIRLWQAWADMPSQARASTLSARHHEISDWDLAVSALRDRPEPLRDLLGTWPVATDALVRCLEAEPKKSDAHLHPLPQKAAKRVRTLMEEADTPPSVRALAYLASPSELPKKAGWADWLTAVDETRDPVVAAVGYLIGRKGGRQRSLEMAAAAMAVLYPLLAADPPHTVWERLRDELSGDPQHWDRCQRLSDDLAKAATKSDNIDLPAVLNAARSRSSAAGEALADSLARRRKADSLWDLLNPFS